MSYKRVVAQLVKQSLPTPEIRGSNPVIGNIFLLNVCRKDEKKMEAGNGPFVKKSGTLKMAQLPNT